jgi:hypothetical protein
MSSVQISTPRLELTALLRKPGGPPVAEALAEAQANLQTLAPESRAELERRMVEADAAFARLGQDFDDALLGEIYQAAVSAIGLGELSGAAPLEVVLTSLCDLVDELRTQGLSDRPAIAVHLQAWRLLLGPGVPPEALLQLLEGLIKVSGRFIQP